MLQSTVSFNELAPLDVADELVVTDKLDVPDKLDLADTSPNSPMATVARFQFEFLIDVT
jgi:hypothetical protein